MAALIAAGTTATTFAAGEFTVTAGTPVGLSITRTTDGPVPTGVDFELAKKSAGGVYVTMLTLSAENILEKGSIFAPGTWAVRRVASSVSAGMDKD